MAKRQAAYQITQDDNGRDSDEMETPSFNSNPEEIAKRPMKGLPKRGGRTTQPSPQKSLESSSNIIGDGSFPAPSFPSPFPSTTTQPPKVPAFSFQLPTSTNPPTLSAPSFPSFQPSTAKPAVAEAPSASKEDDNLFKFYSSMRGLNHSLLEVLRTAFDTDPFTDLEKVLGSALGNYSRHRKDIQATLDAANTKPSLAPPPPSGGFSFGGKPFTSPSGSGTSTPALNPSAPSFTPLGTSGAPSFPKFEPPSFPKFTPPTASTISASLSAVQDSTMEAKESDKAKAIPPSTPFFGKPTGASKPESSAFNAPSSVGEPKEASVDVGLASETSKPSPFKASGFGFGTSSFGSSSSGFGSGTSFGGFSAPSTKTDKPADEQAKASNEAPKSAFGASPFGSTSTAPTFGGFGALTAPSSGSIGNPVGFSFGSSAEQAKKDDTAPPTFGSSTFSTGGSAFGTGGASAFGGVAGKSTFNTPNSASPFGTSSAFGSAGKSAFGTGGSVFGSGGAFGSSAPSTESAPKPASGDSAGLSTPASSFGSTSFGGFGVAGSSPFGSQPASTSTPPTAAGAQEGGDAETAPAAAFEFTSTEIEGAGEENETSVYSVRGKLLKLEDGKWVPLGLGHFKIKKHKETGKQRVLFRTEGNGHVIANYNIFPGMQLTKQAKLLRFPGMEDSKLVPFGLQLKSPEMVDETHDALLKASEESNAR